MNENDGDKKDDATDNDSADNPNLTSDSFKMYYALGTDIDQNSIVETCKNAKDEVNENINIIGSLLQKIDLSWFFTGATG